MDDIQRLASLSLATSKSRRARARRTHEQRQNMLEWVAIAILYIGAMAIIFLTTWERP